MHVSLRKFTVPGDDRLYWTVDVVSRKQHIALLAKSYLSALTLESSLRQLLKEHLETEEVSGG